MWDSKGRGATKSSEGAEANKRLLVKINIRGVIIKWLSLVADASFNGFALGQVTLILLCFLSTIIMLIHFLYHSHFDFH